MHAEFTAPHKSIHSGRHCVNDRKGRIAPLKPRPQPRAWTLIKATNVSSFSHPVPRTPASSLATDTDAAPEAGESLPLTPLFPPAALPPPKALRNCLRPSRLSVRSRKYDTILRARASAPLRVLWERRGKQRDLVSKGWVGVRVCVCTGGCVLDPLPAPPLRSSRVSVRSGKYKTILRARASAHLRVLRKGGGGEEISRMCACVREFFFARDCIFARSVSKSHRVTHTYVVLNRTAQIRQQERCKRKWTTWEDCDHTLLLWG